MGKMASKRQANFELLRIVAMLMIIALHYLVKGEVAVSYSQSSSLINMGARLVEAFCMVAVNCYVLLSGYFLVESEWKMGRVCSLLAQILFYSVLIPIVIFWTGILPVQEFGIYDWIGFLLPIETEHYWFATSYLLLYLFAPILAAGVKSMRKETLQKVILLLLLFFSVGKSVFPVRLVTDRYGYDFGWFLILFLIAAYLRLYGCAWLEKKRNCILLYIGMAAGIFAVWFICSLLGTKIAAFGYYSEMSYTYNHILCLLGAVGFFMLFRNITIKEGRFAEAIRRMAPYTFGVYLIHEHSLVRYQWITWLGVDKVKESWLFLPHMTVCILLIYLVGITIDFVRAYLFALVRKSNKEQKK